MSSEKEYPESYFKDTYHGVTVAPGETWTIQNPFGEVFSTEPSKVVKCKLVIFYGGTKPATANFTLKFE